MSNTRPRRSALTMITAAIALSCGIPLLAQQPPAPTSTVGDASSPLVGLDLSKKMTFVFEDAPVSAILKGMSEQLGFVTITGKLPSARVTIRMRKEVGAEEAIRVLDEILEPLGYIALSSNTAPDPGGAIGGNTILRVVTLAEGRKAQMPVFFGSDPLKIPMSDDLRTQIIQVKNINAGGLLNDLRPLMGGGEDTKNITFNAGSNTIIMTDTAAKVHRLTEIIQGLDNAPELNTVLQYRTLANSNAVDMAQLINSIFSRDNIGSIPPARGGGGATGPASRTDINSGRQSRGGGGTSITPSLVAGSDARTNTVILSGLEDQVQMALDMMNRIDSLPSEDLTRAVLLIKQLKNRDAAAMSQALNQILGGRAGMAARAGT